MSDTNFPVKPLFVTEEGDHVYITSMHQDASGEAKVAVKVIKRAELDTITISLSFDDPTLG